MIVMVVLMLMMMIVMVMLNWDDGDAVYDDDG